MIDFTSNSSLNLSKKTFLYIELCFKQTVCSMTSYAQGLLVLVAMKKTKVGRNFGSGINELGQCVLRTLLCREKFKNTKCRNDR